MGAREAWRGAEPPPAAGKFRPIGARGGGAQRQARAAAHVSAWGCRSWGGTGAGTGTGTAGRGRRHRDSDTGKETPISKPCSRHWDRDLNTGTETRTAVPAPGQGHRHQDSNTDTRTATPAPLRPQPGAGSFIQAAPQELNPGRGPSAGGPPSMESPARSCSCGSPASSLGGPSDSEAEASGPLPGPPKAERSHKRPGGPDPAAPEMPSSPCGGKRPRKGEGGDAPPSNGDHLFAQKCQELRGFIHPLAELLEGLKRGRYDRGLSSFQQSVAMDRIQRIIGVLQKPEMGARYLGTLLQVEGMLRVWFPHVTPKPVQDATPISALRRRPPAGPSGAPCCRRLPEDSPSSIPDGAASEASGTSHQEARPRCHRPAQTGTPPSPPPPDV